MANKRQHNFTPKGVYAVNKKFNFNGKIFKIGSDCDTSKEGMTERKVRQLYDGRFLKFPDVA